MYVLSLFQAEDSDAVVVRVYESFGGTAKFALHSILPFKKITRCNGLEEDTDTQIAWNGHGSEEIILTPFQLATFKLHL